MKILYPSFFVFFCFAGLGASAQTYNMPAGNGVSSSATTCSGNFYDNGGSGGNYSNNQNSAYTFYPSTAANYIRVTFTTFVTENGYDYMEVYDGPGGPLVATYTGSPSTPFTITASSSSVTHGLSFRFHSDGSTRTTGWAATISCTAVPATPPAFTPSAQDCQQGGGITICSNTTFNGNSSGGGTVNDLQSMWDGCLGGENQSSWYYFSPSSSGNIGFTISPSNSSDDYDFAVWGPFTTVTCPMNVVAQPLRCSWAAGGGDTGCGNGATDVSEGSGGNRWVSTFNVNAGEIYVMVIDNYSASSSPFTLNWNLTGGASLDCTVLPVEFLSFTGHKEDGLNVLDWQTATESGNDYFTIERSVNGAPFEALGTVDGAGNSTQVNSYSFVDHQPAEGISYYRIRQTDFNGISTISHIVVLERHSSSTYLVNPFPNPSNGDFSFGFVSDAPSQIHWEITDVTGRVVAAGEKETRAGKNILPCTIKDNPAGVFFLQVTNELSGETYVSRLVKY